MASIDLPRAIQDYFAFAETTATRNGRRFSITLPYIGPNGLLDKLQWWYHLSAAKEKALGDRAPDALRAEAITRFKVHIERWLQNTAQVMYGEGAIPQVSAQDARFVAVHTAGEQSVMSEQTGTIWVDSVDVDSAEEDCIEIVHDEPAELPADKTAFG
jgi:hypothetical protein